MNATCSRRSLFRRPDHLYIVYTNTSNIVYCISNRANPAKWLHKHGIWYGCCAWLFGAFHMTDALFNSIQWLSDTIKRQFRLHISHCVARETEIKVQWKMAAMQPLTLRVNVLMKYVMKTVAIKINTCILCARKLGWLNSHSFNALFRADCCVLSDTSSNAQQLSYHLVFIYTLQLQSWFDIITIIYSVNKYNVSDYIVWIARLYYYFFFFHF